MIFLQLPDEFLSELVALIDGKDTIRILLCGDLNFNSKLVRCTRKMSFEVEGFDIFPFFAYTFPHLEHLDVYMDSDHATYPVTCYERHLRPLNIIASMTRLRFDFAQSLSVLDSPLSILPNLLELRILGSNKRLEERHLRDLPAALQMLQISCASTRLPETCLDHLPETLQELVIPFITLVHTGDIKSPSKVTWPPNLKKLNVPLSRLLPLSHLPPSVEFLDTSPSMSSSPQTRDQLPMSSLPLGLKRFVLVGFSDNSRVLVDASMPPGITQWSVTLEPSPGTELEAKIFPAKIRLSPLPKYLRSYPRCIGKQFPHLEHLLLPPKDLPANADPDHNSSSTTTDDSSQSPLFVFPPALQSLIIAASSSYKPDVFAFLPTKLTRLTSHLETLQQAQLLPRSLTSLSLVPYIATRLSTETLQALPINLKRLELSLAHLGTPENILALPPHLEYLTLSVSHSTQADSLNVINDESFGTLFPAELLSLTLSITGTSCRYQHWLGGLSHLTKLQSLAVWVHRTLPLSGEHDFLFRLPRSLRTLFLPADPSWVHQPTIFQHLPPLHSFTLQSSGIGNRHPIFSDSHFSFLPPSITLLSITDVFGLTPHFFTVIPPGIFIIDALNDSPGWAEAKDAYFNQPWWTGLCPLPSH